MKILLKILKPLSFLPALILMYFIYGFSAMPGEDSGKLSYQVSLKIVEVKSELLREGLGEYEIAEQADFIHPYVRKAAHMTEYFLLAIAVSFPLYIYGVRGLALILICGIFCVSFAGLDEYHQSFVEGRGPSKTDVLIDSCGVFLGILLVQAFCWAASHNPAKRAKAT